MAQLRSIMIHDQVYVSLRRAIMSGHFKPGDQLSARGLAKDFGISQMPVRDALNRLTSDRAVERTGDRRYCIPKLDAEYVADLRTARVINEGAATAIATSKMTKKAMQEINRAQELIEEAAKYSLSVDELGQDDVSEYVFLNKQFHFAIYKAAESPVLLSIIETLWLRYAPGIALYLHISFDNASKPELARINKAHHSSHKRIIRALKTGDAEKSRAMMIEDITPYEKIIEATQSDHTERKSEKHITDFIE